MTISQIALAIVTLVAVLHGVTPSVRAAEPIAYLVRARIDAERGLVAARMRVQVRMAAGEDHVRLWLYPDRTAVEPSEIDEISWRWIHPVDPDFGGVDVESLRVNGDAVEGRYERAPAGTPRGRDFLGADLVVPIEAGAARTVRIEIDFRLRVPERFGRFGRARDLLAMTCPWYPLVVGDDDAWWHDATHRVGVEMVDGSEAALAGTLVGARGEVDTRGPYVPLLAAERLHETRVPAGRLTLRYLTTERPYRDPPPSQVRDVVRIDIPELLGEVGRDVDATMRAVRVPISDAEPAVAVVHSRTELAATAPGMVLLSDRAFELFPIEQTRAFHRRAVRRALFQHQLGPTVARVDPPADRSWSAELRAVLLVDLDDARREGRAQTPEELLGFASFNPVVDQLLNAPQLPFEDVYFGTIEEADAFRDDPARARKRIARGRRLLESARDVLSPRRFQQACRTLIAGRTSAATVIERRWLDYPNREVNYRIVRHVSRRRPDGTYAHEIVIARDGAQRVEPVTVEIEDEDDRVLRGRWDGAGRAGVVRLESRAPIDDVQIDPDSRLPQSPRVADGHPRRDDTTSLPWRPPLMRAFDVDLVLAEGRIDGFVDFAMRRRYDLENTIAFAAQTSAASWGGSVRYVRGVGPKIDLNRRAAYLSFALEGERLRPSFDPDGIGGVSLALIAGGGIDTRRYFIDPRAGFALAGSVGLAGVRRDEGEYSVSLQAHVRGNLTLPLSWRHVLALFAGAGYVTLDPQPGEMLALGGRFLLRGYGADELLARGRVYGVAEWRWTAVTDRAWNVVHIGWIRELQLVAFTAAGLPIQPVETDPEDESGPHRSAGPLALEFGAGIHLLFDYGGVQPGVLCLEVAVPERTLLGEPTNRPPVGVYVTFDQYF